MAPFTENETDKLDWQLMQNGAVNLYFQMAILERDLSWLREHGYQIESIDCQELPAFYRQMSIAFRFKEHFSYDDWTGNLDALNDACRCLEIDSEGGLVLCFIRYDLLKAASPDLAQGLLDIIESNSRDQLLFGRRLLALVQSDDPRIQFGPIGAKTANWNLSEESNKNRGL